MDDLSRRDSLVALGLLGDKMPQVVGQVLGRHVTLGGSLGQSLEANSLQFLWDAFINLPQRSWLKVRDLLQQLGLGVSTKGMPSDQQFVKDHAQAEDVRAAVDAMTFPTS